MKKIPILIFVTLFLSSVLFAHAQTENLGFGEQSMTELYYNSYQNFKFDERTYDELESPQIKMFFQNMERYILPETSVKLYLISGNKNNTYPSNKDSKDSIISYKEFKLGNINPGEILEKNFSIQIPKGANSGQYRIEFYMASGSNPIIGDDVSFFDPQSFPFKVENTNKETFPKVKFNREITNFAGAYAQTGPGVDKEKIVPITLSIINEENYDFKGKLEFEVCKFNDFPKCDLLEKKEFDINLKPGIQTDIIEYKTPDKSFAYEIVFKLKDKSNNLVSYYKTRYITNGEHVSIKKFTLNSQNLTDEKENNFFLTYTGNYYPSDGLVEDALIKVEITSKDNKKIFEEEFLSSNLKNAPIKTDEIYYLKDHFNSNQKFESYKACVSIFDKQKQELYDKYCFKTYEVAKKEQTLIKKNTSTHVKPYEVSFLVTIIILVTSGAIFWFSLIFRSKKKGIKK